MKKITSVLMTFIMLLIIIIPPNNSSAATINSKAGKVAVSSGTLNVRSSMSTTSTIKKSLKKDSYITLISKSGNWWYVEYAKNSYGYCHSNYITVLNGTTKLVNITSGSLNVRSGAGSNYSKIGSLLKGEVVIVLSTIGNWSKILYHGTKTGYVSKTYLSDNISQNNEYKAISLNVPSFKQTDGRWANVKIGTSGKTIAQIGCATTGIAMVESYRTKTTIFPNEMAKKLKYTSSGSVYWPNDYTAVTNSTGYLNKIYNELKNGKCVLFGGKNSYGAQHWIVITGYKGGSTLSASGFTINDPGSNTRTTLQSFLNSYPRFYKYFIY